MPAEFLTFALAAPVAAMGEIAVGERRGGWDRPGRSAVLGLVAGCLGIDREDEAAHAALEAGYGLALRRQSLGPLLADYHTVQAPPQRQGRRFATRAEELAAGDLETMITRRDYRTDLLVLVAIWPRSETAQWSLAELETALRQPHYTPYFGRKACPLMLPMAPRIEQATDPAAALTMRAAAGPQPERQFTGFGPPLVTMSASDARQFDDLNINHIESRRDAVASRRRWQFALRQDAILVEATS
jgi:CRISPR system Cascade subunit CasD